jgi:hypothetical protein
MNVTEYVCPLCNRRIDVKERPVCPGCEVPMNREGFQEKNCSVSVKFVSNEKRKNVKWFISPGDSYLVIGYSIKLEDLREDDRDAVRRCVDAMCNILAEPLYDKETKAEISFDEESIRVSREVGESDLKNLSFPSIEKVIEEIIEYTAKQLKRGKEVFTSIITLSSSGGLDDFKSIEEYFREKGRMIVYGIPGCVIHEEKVIDGTHIANPQELRERDEKKERENVERFKKYEEEKNLSLFKRCS